MVKRILLVLCVVVVAVIAAIGFRTATVFEDRQIAPAAEVGEVGVDRSAALRRFSEALKIPTISHDDRDDFDAAAFLEFHAFLRAAYPRVHEHAELTVINDYSLLYRLPGADGALQPVLFMAHMDVVPVDEITRGEWTHAPFVGTVDVDTVWGRGAIDDKIGVISLMEAMEMLLAEGVTPRRTVYLAFGHDEEVGGTDGAARIAERLEHQGVRFDFVVDEGGMVLPPGVMPVPDRPVAIVGVAEKGYVDLRLTANAAGGHSSTPPDQTALGIVSRAIVRVEGNPFPASLDHTLRTYEAIGSYVPFAARLPMSNLWLFSPLVESTLLAAPAAAAGVRTTIAATMASGSPKPNVLPTRATAVINFRILPGETVESVRQRVISLIDDERVEVTAEFNVEPSPVSPLDTRGYELIASIIRGMDDNALVAPYLTPGGTDAKYFYNLSDNVYRFRMMRMDAQASVLYHGIDERVAIDDYLLTISFYYHLLRRSMEA